MKRILRVKLMSGALVLAGAMLAHTTSALAQDYGPGGGYDYAPAGQPLNNLVSRIALYPDPLLAQIFAASAFPDQIAAAAQGSGGPFDPSVEALMQYPSVLQMMASDPAWTQALGQAVMQDQGALMDTVQNLRREAQQYGYLQSSPQMQVVDDGGYIGIEPVGAYMYVPVYDPYIVFARPRPGFFVGGAIRFGSRFSWVGGGYNRFNWRNHQVYVNRRVWSPPVHRVYQQQQRYYDRGRFDNGSNYRNSNNGWNRGYTQQQQPQQRQDWNRNYTQQQQQQQQQQQRQNWNRNYTPQAAQPAPQQNVAPQQQYQQRQNWNRNYTPQAAQPAPQQNVAPQQQYQQRQNWNRNYTPQAAQPAPQQNVAPQQQQPRRDFGRQMEQGTMQAPRQEPRNNEPRFREHADRSGRRH